MGTPDGTPEFDLEHLLDGRWGRDGLSQILAAAAGPGTARELDGLSAATAAFSAAGPGPDAVPPRRKPMLKSVLAKLLAAKAAAVLAGTAAMSGVALAASTGTLPAPLQDAAHAIGAPAAHVAHDTTDAQGPTSGDPATEPTGAPTVRPTNTPSPSLVGLCHAWSENEHGNRATNPAFSVLVTTAGGSAQVSAYCATLLASVAAHADATPEASESAESTESPEAEHSHPAEPSHSHDATEGNEHKDGRHSEAPEPRSTETPEPAETHSAEPTHPSGSGHDSGSHASDGHGDGHGDGRSESGSGDSSGDN